jgi:hypothetical protein
LFRFLRAAFSFLRAFTSDDDEEEGGGEVGAGAGTGREEAQEGIVGGLFGRCSRARAPLCYIRRADTFKRVDETSPRLANVVGKGRFSLLDFLPEV